MEEKLTRSYIKVDSSPVTLKHRTAPDAMKYFAKTNPNGDSVVFVSTDGTRECVTWSQLYQKSQKMARSLINMGIKKGEIVAINVRCCPEWLYCTFGAMMAGAIPVSISFTYTDGSDLTSLMEKMEKCSLLILDPGAESINWNILHKVLDEYKADGRVRSQKMPYLRYVLGIRFDGHPDAPNVKDMRDLLTEDHPDIELPVIRPDDLIGLFQTSGSTGVPKLVAHVQESFVKIHDDSCVIELLKPKYILFNDRPFNWSGGYPFSIFTGQTRVTLSEFCDLPIDKLSFMIDVIVKEKCSMIVALPPMIYEIIKRQKDLPEQWPVVGIMTSGQPLSKRLADCVGEACQYILCVYAATEFAFVMEAKINDPNDFVDFGCGKPLNMPGLEIKIADENAEIVPVDKRGEIYIRSDFMFTGYLNDAEKTRKVMSEDGWYKTDDIGRMTEDGQFFVEGRKSNMIISGGFNVAPEILENVMKTFPGIDSVVIVPVPDDVYYQVLCACIVKKSDCEVTEEDIRKYCSEYHADKPGLFTVLPKYYMFFDSFPETKSGKTYRKGLEKLALQKFCQ